MVPPYRDEKLPALGRFENPITDPDLAASEEADGRGSLILDLNGVVRFCSTSLTQLLGCATADVVGKSVGSFLPGLPLREKTPGYNIAVTLVLFGSPGQPLQMSLPDGRTQAVRASVDYLDLDAGGMFSVELSWPLPPSALNASF